MSQFDYIIVGAGSAGCVLADRLSRNGSINVLLIESGGRDKDPMIKVPKGFAKVLPKPNYMWYMPTDPFGPDKRVEVWMRGRTLGGSSAVNGMVYNRGMEADWNSIAELGNPAWGYADIIEAYKSFENNEYGASPTRGTGGPLNISSDTEREDPLCDEFIASAGKLGMAKVQDYNEADGERIGYTMANIKAGRRVSSAHAFLHPAEKRPNLTIAIGSTADQILFDGDRAVGVRVRHDGQVIDHHAKREVILSLGSVQTPKLLQLSGIGPADTLKSAGIQVRVAQDSVGAGMREHRCLVNQYQLNTKMGYNPRLATRTRQTLEGMKYYATHKGPLARPCYDVIAFCKTEEGLDRPDAQLLMGPFSVGKQVEGKGVQPDSAPGIQCIGFILRPESKGSIHITSSNPDAPLSIATEYYVTDYDKKVAVGIMRKIRSVFEQSPIADRVTRETTPGPGVTSDDDIVADAVANGWCGYHAIGTSAMGPDDDAVVDSELRVRGVEGLRVMDASVLPLMVSGNLNGPMMAMAWRLSDMILGEQVASGPRSLR